MDDDRIQWAGQGLKYWSNREGNNDNNMFYEISTVLAQKLRINRYGLEELNINKWDLLKGLCVCQANSEYYYSSCRWTVQVGLILLMRKTGRSFVIAIIINECDLKNWIRSKSFYVKKEEEGMNEKFLPRRRWLMMMRVAYYVVIMASTNCSYCSSSSCCCRKWRKHFGIPTGVFITALLVSRPSHLSFTFSAAAPDLAMKDDDEEY